jgi:hypothetical protein
MHRMARAINGLSEIASHFYIMQISPSEDNSILVPAASVVSAENSTSNNR